MAHTAVYSYHGNLHDIGGTALYGRVDGIALGIATHHGIVAVDVGQGTAAMEDGFGVTLLACHGNTSIHIFLHTGIGMEITVDKLLCFAPAASEAFCKTKGADAIDDAEIGGFGSSALVGRYLRYILMENL